eukprot:456530_1
MDLKYAVQTIQILNRDDEESTMTVDQFLAQNSPHHSSYILSDVDEELLLLIEFKHEVDLRSVKLYAESNCSSDKDISAPKQIHIHVMEDMNKGFQEMKSINTYDKSVTCSSDKLKKGQKINLQKNNPKSVLKFKKTRYLAIYVQSNQANVEKTCINGLKLKGNDTYDINNNQYVSNNFNVLPVSQNENQKKHKSFVIDSGHILKRDICQNLSKCHHFNRLHFIMQKYNQALIPPAEIIQEYRNTINIIEIVDDFIHLIHQHDTDNHFELISSRFGRCDISKCNIFRRHHISRNKVAHKSNEFDTEEFPWIQIMDRIHCFFQHTFDMGFKVTAKDRNAILTADNEEKYTNNDQYSFDRYVTSSRINKLYQKLAKQRVTFKRIYPQLDKILQKKYNQIHIIPNSSTDSIKKYHLGYKIKYQSEECLDGMQIGYNVNDNIIPIIISKRYDSFKDEMTQNKKVKLTKPQFDSELTKAQIHYNSTFCKSKFRPILYKDNQWQTKPLYITVENILSAQIYCNFSELQYEFSKTYREGYVGDEYKGEHDIFYHLGKNLKRAVQAFGTPILDGKIRKFYHGISDQLAFPKYINQADSSCVVIQCPLSTSISFEVAANFANSNRGMIVEFGYGYGVLSMTFTSDDGHKIVQHYSPRYLSVSWLSDYTNEKECLFLQSQHPAAINNVVDVRNNYEYGVIIDTLKAIEHFTYSSDSTQDYGANIYELMSVLIEDRLSVGFSYKSFSSMTLYGKQLIETYFNNKNDIVLNFDRIQSCLSLSQYLCHSKDDWIKLTEMFALFPNTIKIQIEKLPKFTTFMLIDIWNFVSRNPNLRLKSMEVKFISECNMENTVTDKYVKYFKSINFVLTTSKNGIKIDKGKDKSTQ